MLNLKLLTALLTVALSLSMTSATPSQASTNPQPEITAPMENSFEKLISFGFDNTEMAGLGFTVDGSKMTSISGAKAVKGSNPAYGLRDPSIARYRGAYYMVATRALRSNYLGTGATVMTLMRSTNLVDWEQLPDIPARVTGTTRAWAPEIFVDGSDVYVYYAVSTDTTENAALITKFDIYAQKAMNDTLTSWSKLTKMTGLVTPKVIDAHVTKMSGDSRGNYVMFYKDETNMDICRAWAATPFGPWTTDRTGPWMGHSNMTEGPQLMPKEGGGWRLFYDHYADNQLAYRDSADLDTWSAEVNLTYPGSIRHPGYLWLSDLEWMTISNRPRTVRTYNTHNIASGTQTIVPLGNAEGDPAMWNSSNPTRLTAAVSGWYNLNFSLGWPSNGNGPRSLGFRFSNGGVYQWRDSRQATGGGYGTEHNASDRFWLNTGEYVEIIALQSSGTTLAVNAVATLSKE